MLKKIFIILKVVVILNLLYTLINREWTATFVCLLTIIFLFISDFFKKKLFYGDVFKLLIYIFLIFSLVGGEVYYLYVRISYFDVIMHIFSSFIISGLVFYLIKYYKCNICNKLITLFVFSVAMMTAAMWELTEFSIDRIFNVDMQKDTVINEINSVMLISDGRGVGHVMVDKMRLGNSIFEGYLDIGLYDTMYDIVCAGIGSIILIIIYRIKEAF